MMGRDGAGPLGEPQSLFGTGGPGSPARAHNDNVTDWCLAEFREAYGDPSIDKDAIWEYLYGVMHAPDWRERYRNDLRKSLPRVPLAADFEAFRRAGRELMDLHTGFETCPEADIELEVDSKSGSRKMLDLMSSPPPPEFSEDALRIEGNMKLALDEESGAHVLHINSRCRLIGIPAEAFEYEVSGRSPLHWAVASLRHKTDKNSGITDDPNRWHAWSDDPFGLIRHLRRLIHIGIRSAEVIANLPPSLDGPIGPANGVLDPATGVPNPAAGTPNPAAGAPKPAAGAPNPAAASTRNPATDTHGGEEN